VQEEGSSIVFMSTDHGAGAGAGAGQLQSVSSTNHSPLLLFKFIF